MAGERFKAGPEMAGEAVNPITEGVIWKQLLLYFAPLLIASCLQLLYNTADTIIAGRFIGKIALTAVGGSAGQIYAMVTEFMIGVSGGAGVILSQAYGARDEERLDDSLHNAVTLALLLGALITAAGLAASGPALRLAGVPASTMGDSLTYLRIVFAGLIPNILYNMGAAVLRAVGDSKRPLHFLLICSGLNIVLDLLFVAVLRMGIAGAALATVLSQTVSAALILYTLVKGTGTAQMPQLDLWRLRLQRSIAAKMLRIGIPLGFETLMYTFSCVVLTSAVNTFGTDTVAAYAGFVRIESFYWILEAAFAVSITTFVGQNYGAGRIDAAVLKIGVDMMRYLLPFYILYIPSGVFFSTLRGMGDSLRPTIITFAGVCLLRIAWVAWVFPRFPTIRALLFCFPVSWSITSVTYLVYYRWFIQNN